VLAGDILKANARSFSDRVGLIDEQGTRLSWTQLNSRVNSLANALLLMGVKKGDTVAIICENRHEFVEILFAAFKIGAIPGGINYRFTAEQIEALLEHFGAVALFVQSKYAPTINTISPKLVNVKHFIGIGEGHSYPHDHESLIAQNVADEPEVELRDSDICTVIFTSGTTGLPKGVVHSHRDLTSSNIGEFYVYRFNPDDRALIGSPLFSASGEMLTLAALFAGSTTVVHTFSGRSFLEMIEKERVTVITSMIPTRFHIIQEFLKTATRKYNLDSVEKMGIGPQSITWAQLKEMAELFPNLHNINKAFVGSEMSIATALMPYEVAAGLRADATDEEKRRLESVGKPILDYEVKIVDEDGKEVPAGQPGEVLIRSGTVTDASYWARPVLTHQKFRDGWYHTSDLGVIDEHGYLYYGGRKDDMIRSGAFFVAPSQVEGVISTHPAVHECAVFGVPDEKWGEAVAAAVSLKKDQKSTEEELREHCRKYLSGFQIPKSIQIMDELPKDPGTKKILVRELRKLYK
jgi:acyl-CoA synthetase (AMP-forming)/AMP-acid ligase II